MLCVCIMQSGRRRLGMLHAGPALWLLELSLLVVFVLASSSNKGDCSRFP